MLMMNSIICKLMFGLLCLTEWAEDGHISKNPAAPDELMRALYLVVLQCHMQTGIVKASFAALQPDNGLEILSFLPAIGSNGR